MNRGPQPSAKWMNVDWSQSNAVIAAMMGEKVKTVSRNRVRRGFKMQPGPKPKLDRAAVDLIQRMKVTGQDYKDIAMLLHVTPNTVGRALRREGIASVRQKARERKSREQKRAYGRAMMRKYRKIHGAKYGKKPKDTLATGDDCGTISTLPKRDVGVCVT